MTHDDARDLLDAWLDNELDPATATAVDRHIVECARCAGRVADRRRLSDVLRTPGVRHATPPTAPLALARVVGAPQARARAHWASRSAWYRAAAASVIVGVGGFWIGMQVQGSRFERDELVAAHVRANLSSNPIDIASSDHHTVKPWFGEHLPFSPPVPQFGAGGDTLVGGRIDVIARRRVAVLIYRHGNHNVDVFVMPASAGVRPATAASVDGFNLLRSRWGDFDIAWVSDASREELDAFRAHWLERAAEQIKP